MQNNFEKHCIKGRDFLQKTADNLGYPNDLIKAERILKAVLHSLRNRLSVEDSFQFMSQLPLLIKGIYVDGWKISKEFVRIKHLDEFINEVKHEAGNTAEVDFSNNSIAINSIKNVFKTIVQQVSPGEVEHLKAVFPKELKQLWEESILA
jgi:uncharacterized protein (DUF2267 family)